MTENLVWGLKL